MVFARSAAMSFNRLVDRKIDAENPRTAGRHIPSGQLSVGAVLFFTVFCSVGFIASTCLLLPKNPFPAVLSVPTLLFIFGYSFAKRWTIASHFWLGMALMIAPMGAWITVRPEIAAAPLVLGLAVLFWVAGFDIIYACQDYAFDVQKGLFSIPAKFGISGALRIAALCHALMLWLLLLLPTVYPKFGVIYYGGVSCITLILLAEHYVIRPRRQEGKLQVDLTKINFAFFHLNALVSLGLLAIGLLGLLW